MTLDKADQVGVGPSRGCFVGQNWGRELDVSPPQGVHGEKRVRVVRHLLSG